MVERLAQLQPRALALVMASAVGLTVLASYLYLLKSPAAEYRRLAQAREVLAAELDSSGDTPVKIAELEREVGALEGTLRRDGQPVPLNQMESHVIGRLDGISSRHAVRLHRVKPGATRSVLMFEEIPFEIEIAGGYFEVYDWLIAVERELGPMVVKQFEITPEGDDGQTRMALTIVSYRQAEGAP